MLNYKDFLTIPRGVSQDDFAKKKPKLEDVRIVKFTRGSYEMFWKTGYSQVFNSAQFLQRKILKSLQSFESFPSKQTPRGANTAKISKIVEKLCPHMDLMKRKF